MTKKDSCLVCQIVDGKIPAKIVYEDDHCLGILDINGANPGHVFIIPKRHHPILEQVPDNELAGIFSAANRISSALFEALEIGGTNIFITNGIPAGQTIAHFMVNVIPRTKEDGINLQWPPKQVEDEQLETLALKIREEMEGAELPDKQPATEGLASHSAPSAVVSDDEFARYTKRMERLP